MNKAIILAAGQGTRIGSDIPKQFIDIEGKLLIEYTIDVFEAHPLIDSIVIVSPQAYIKMVQSLVAKNKYQKVCAIVAGGQERSDSSMAAICTCDDDDEILLFHDCARPLVSNRIIDECIDSMTEYDAVTVAFPSTDTVYLTDGHGGIVDIPSRNIVFQAQTPQCFRLSTIKKAYQLALTDPSYKPTDDCSLVFRYFPDIKIHIVTGEVQNIKITYPEDIDFFRRHKKPHNP